MSQNTDICQKPNTNTKKTWKEGSDKSLIAESLLREGNLKVPKIAELSGLKDRQVYNIKRNLIKDNYGLHRIAVRGVKKLAMGQTFGKIEDVKDSTALAACNTILERTEPKIQKIEQTSHNINVTAEHREYILRSIRSFSPALSQHIVDTQDIVVSDNQTVKEIESDKSLINKDNT